MRWRFGVLRWRTPARVVVGVDVGPTFAHGLVLSGTTQQPTYVQVMQRERLPEAWLNEGWLTQPQAMGQWLRAQWQQQRVKPRMLCMRVDPALVSSHSVSLPAGLSSEDVAFQVQAEVLAQVQAQAQAQSQPHASPQTVCVDYRRASVMPAETVQTQDVLTYQVHALPCSVVDALQQLAKAARVELVGVTCLHDVHQTQLHSELRRKTWQGLSSDSWDRATQEPVTLYLAGCAWDEDVLNFVRRRVRPDQPQRRRWWQHVALSAFAGSAAATALSGGLAWAAHTQRDQLGDEAAIARALAQAQQAHAQAKQLQQRVADQNRWLQARRTEHQHTLAWALLLNQDLQGLWLSEVTLQGKHWSMQGEALTATQAQRLMTQLKALDIWARPPEMPQLQTSSKRQGVGLPPWQFRIEAQLKEVV